MFQLTNLESFNPSKQNILPCFVSITFNQKFHKSNPISISCTTVTFLKLYSLPLRYMYVNCTCNVQYLHTDTPTPRMMIIHDGVYIFKSRTLLGHARIHTEMSKPSKSLTKYFIYSLVRVIKKWIIFSLIVKILLMKIYLQKIYLLYHLLLTGLE